MSRLAVVTCALALGCGGAPSTPDPALPFRYFLVTEPVGPLQRGFGVAMEQLLGGAIRTRAGHVVPLASLDEARPPRGLAVTRLGLAWVVESHAGVWARPDDRERPLSTRAALSTVVVRDRPAPPGWRAVEGGYMRASELRVPVAAVRPTEVAPGERWIDVDTQNETLAVYDGDALRLVTLVATGQGRPGTRFATPRGLYHVQYKLPTATMDNVDEDRAADVAPYSFEEVPWVQYFHKEVALHGTYWHQRFGQAVSHGCVNLTPADAQQVYALTRASTSAYAGTVVRVR
jgi:lipoprotein-anchoring transpeptidase ErfK/SrfK